jgi:hypothetical protein
VERTSTRRFAKGAVALRITLGAAGIEPRHEGFNAPAAFGPPATPIVTFGSGRNPGARVTVEVTEPATAAPGTAVPTAPGTAGTAPGTTVGSVPGAAGVVRPPKQQPVRARAVTVRPTEFRMLMRAP